MEFEASSDLVEFKERLDFQAQVRSSFDDFVVPKAYLKRRNLENLFFFLRFHSFPDYHSPIADWTSLSVSLCFVHIAFRVLDCFDELIHACVCGAHSMHHLCWRASDSSGTTTRGQIDDVCGSNVRCCPSFVPTHIDIP